jgi:hypothetical protein
MKALLVSLICVVGLLVAGCGAGAKSRPPSAQPTPNLTAVDETATAVAPPKATPTPSDAAAASGSSILPLLLGDAFGSGADTASLGAGDPALEQYLLRPSDLPDGYTSLDQNNQRVHDGISNSGTIDVATSTLAKGQQGDPNATLVLSMAMKFSDLRDLDHAFGDLNADSLQDQLGQSGAIPGGLFKDVKILPTDGLGGHAAGFSITMDLGALFGAISGGLAGDDGTPLAFPSDVPSQVRIQMYIFGQGQYAGAVMTASYGSEDQRLDLVSLAKTAETRLPSSP